jgi:hypothetical protein
MKLEHEVKVRKILEEASSWSRSFFVIGARGKNE